MQSEHYVLVEEVAKAYNVCEETVRRWCRDGVLIGAIRARRAWRIPKRYAGGTVDLSKQEKAEVIQ
jgi:predicted site-specific integrase-resolvase